MDLRSWKKVLLEWVKECNFIDNNFRNLENSDLDTFFEVYVQQNAITLLAQQQQMEKRARMLQEQGEEKKPLVPLPSLLVDFLRSLYPDFSPHLEQDGSIVTSDYLYVYTLLMHYACVKNPTEIFHIICKRLPDVTQECIAKFFEQSVSKPQLNRENMRQALANVSVVYRRADIPKRSHIKSTNNNVSSNSLNVSSSSCTSNNNNSFDSNQENSNQSLDESQREDGDQVDTVSLAVASPSRPKDMPSTSQRLQINGNIPPPTPKSEMLEQQNRELLGLRAQLQTERYERSALEEQILENEHLINSLNKDNNEKKQQLANLKASLENGDEDAIDNDMRNYVPNEIEHLKRSMRKEIANKEMIIGETNDRLQDLQNENSELMSKLKISEKQLKVCMDRISELEMRLEHHGNSLKYREEELNCLQRDKMELEQCLQEARDELHQRREILNSSADLLDISTSASANSHNVTPENLATSVIDKQLRETQQEKDQLKLQLDEISEMRTKWSDKLFKLLKQFHGSLDRNEWHDVDEIDIIEQTLQQLDENWTFEQQRAKQLQQLCDKHAHSHNQLLDHIQQLHGNVQTLEQQLDKSRQSYNEREQQYKIEWQERQSHYSNDIKELQKKLEQQITRYDTVHKQHENLLNRYDELHANATEADRHLCQMRNKMTEKEKQFEQLGSEILQLRSINVSHEERINTLVSERLNEKERSEKQIEQLTNQIDRNKQMLDHVRCKYKQCKQQLFVRSNKMDELINSLQVNHWDEANKKVDELVKTKFRNEQDQGTIIAAMEEQMKNATVSHEKQLSDLRKQLLTATERYDEQRARQCEFIHQIQTDLTDREHKLQHDILLRKAANDERLTKLRQQLNNIKIQMEQFLDRISRMFGIYNNNDNEQIVMAEGVDNNNESRSAIRQRRLEEIEGLIQQLLVNKNEMQTTIEDQTVQLSELTRQHALAITGNQQWTAKMKRDQDQRESLIRSLEASAEKLRIVMTQKDAEINASNHYSKQLQMELNSERTKVEQLMAKLAKTMEQLEVQDLAAIEMVASLNDVIISIPINRRPQAAANQTQSSCCESSNFSQLRFKISQFKTIFVELESTRKSIDRKYTEISREASDLANAKAQLERQVACLEDKLKGGNELANTKLSNQLKHLNSALQNLEEVNEKLSTDNNRLQSLFSELDSVQLSSHAQMASLQSDLSDRDKKLAHYQEIIQSNEMKILQIDEQCKKLQQQLSQKIDESNNQNEDADKQLRVILQLHDDIELIRKELEKKTNLLDEANLDLEKYRKDIQQLEEKHNATVSKLENLTAEEAKSDLEFKELRVQLNHREVDILRLTENIKKIENRGMIEKVERNKELNKVQHQLERIQEKFDGAQQKITGLVGKNESLLGQMSEQAQFLTNREKQLNNLKLEMASEKEKVKELKQELTNLELEKIKLIEEKHQLQSQLQECNEMLREQKDLVVEVRQQLAKELDQNKVQQTELLKQSHELKRTKSQVESTTQRTEKMAIKLGEVQASLIKHQRELNQCKLTQEAQTETISSLQCEKESLQKHLAQNKDRLAKMELKAVNQYKLAQEAHDEMIATLQSEKDSLQSKLQQANENLTKLEAESETKIVLLQQKLEHMQQMKQNAEIERANINDRINKLDILRETQEKNLRDLNHQLIKTDEEKVQLNYEVGGLNADNQQKKIQLVEMNAKLQESIESLNEMKNKLRIVQADKDQAIEDNAQLNCKYNDLTQELDGHRLIQESLQCELEEKTRELEMERKETDKSIGRYKARLDSLQQELAEKIQELNDVQSNHNDLCATYTKHSELDTNDKEAAMEQLHEERNKRQQLELDCQILQAKYRDAKDEVLRCEQKIKDQRLEMEGKLEKMKNKMRTLYTAEVTRMKEKQERDATKNKGELDAINAQNAKYEEHTRKLSNQIVRLNDKILEQQKQHAILSTKLRHLESTNCISTATSGTPSLNGGESSGVGTANDDWQPFKRPNSIPSANLGTNLAMEDEEGEVFNNTYLTDLKLGRVPDTMMTAEELQYRNSLQPPHLKSTYAAQYDLGGIPDDDLRDGPHSCSLDDSMSALLSTTGTSTGARKKTMGTHYKRPGPPTPSKNGGRLSFGSSEPPREILREQCDNTGTGTSKTPARFKIFSSRFSIGSSSNSSGLPRDEPPRRKGQNLLTGLHRRKLQLRAMADGMRTSTPRKSRSYYDQRRLFSVSDAMSEADINEKKSADRLDLVDKQTEEEEEEKEEEEEEEEEEEVEEESATPHLSNGALLAITKGVSRRISTNRRCSVTTSSGSGGHHMGNVNNCQRRRKVRMGNAGGRVSLYLHGNIFAKTGSNCKRFASANISGQRQQQRKKIRQQRLGCFDRARQLSPINATYNVENVEEIKSLSPDNNNYSLHNRNDRKEIMMHLGNTVVVERHQKKSNGIDIESKLASTINVAAATFNIKDSFQQTSLGETTKQLQKQFEDEHLGLCSFWLTTNIGNVGNDDDDDDDDGNGDNDDNHDYHFEQICRDTASSAPFHLEPLHYKDMDNEVKQVQQQVEVGLGKLESELDFDINSQHTISGITNASCATNMTSASSHKSCTIYSLGKVQTHRLPHININHVQHLTTGGGTKEQELHQQYYRIGSKHSISLFELFQMFGLLNFTGHLIITLILSFLILLYCWTK